MGWKYVTVYNKIGDTGVLLPVIFPDKLVHSQVYSRIRTVMPGWLGNGGVKPFSAGTIEHIQVVGLGGNSETLSIGSRPDDKETIEQFSYFHGIIV